MSFAKSLLIMLVIFGVGLIGYQIGVTQAITAAPGAAPAVAPVAYGYYPWGYGFGFFGFLWMILFIFLVLGLVRGMFWRRHGWGGHAWGGSWERGVPPWIEEWHRRTHESKGHAGTV